MTLKKMLEKLVCLALENRELQQTPESGIS